MHQYTSARERQRETEWEKREREGWEGCARPSLIHPPPPLPHQGGGLSQLPILPASWSPLCSIFSCCQPLWAWPWHTTLALKVTSLCLWVHSAWFLHFNSCYQECILNGIHPSYQISEHQEYQALVSGVTLNLRGSAAATSLVVQSCGMLFFFVF